VKRFLARVLALLCAPGGALAAAQPGFWMPVRASTTAGRVDDLFNFILVTAVVFFVLIVTLMTFFLVRYRRRPGREAEPSAHHNTALELTWSLIPLVLLVIIFVLGFRSYLDMSVAPQNSLQVSVTAQRWFWSFTYPNGYSDANLHVPANTPVELTLTSQDVIHSLFIPAFRVKKDVVPGRYNKAWFEANTPGEFLIVCAEYCGRSHSDMMANVVVHEPGGFEKWMDEAANWIDKLSPAEAGLRLYTTLGCAACHSTDGTARVGPTFQGMFGHEVALKSGEKAAVDENYVRESVLQPAAKVVAGFEPVMPTYQGRVKDKEITALIEYLKTLK
jgi:cytochrome c oxidase subunit 2